ncbi:caspase domain-containing protein [Chaetomium sp. MPI-SDFR-AT-0129]|nr:caspase domain-containing protein [Chaetomium sp. MPI-SDFR-AT-0129]
MAEKSNKGRKSALLIGINKYNSPALTNLRGSLSDVETTESFLTKVAGIPPNNITKLISPPNSPNDRLPNFKNIKSAFNTLAHDAQPGDFIYIHYSGHGTRLETIFAELKSQHTDYDECLVLARRDGKLDHLRDVEIAFLLKQIADKGATVTFVLDCCHSGGATRGDDEEECGVVRGSGEIPDDNFFDLNRKPIQSVEDLEDAWGQHPDDSDDDDDDDAGRGGSVVEHWLTASKGINFLAACQPKQKAQEVPRRANVRRGLFTDCLARVIEQNKGADRLRRLSCDVVSNLVAHTLKTHEQRSKSREQDVVFGGQGDRHIFGVESVEDSPVVVAGVERLGSGGLEVGLTAGVAQGVCLDDIFAIYPSDRPLATLADYTAPLATCSVTKVTDLADFTCKAHIQSNSTNLELVRVGCVAVSLCSILKDHVLQPKGVWVSAAAVENDTAERPDPVDVQKVRACISRGESKLLELKDNANGSSTIFFTPHQAEAKVVVTGQGPEDVLAHLDHLTVFYNLFNLSTDNAAQQERGLTVRKIGYLNEGVKVPDLRGFPLKNPLPLDAGLEPLPPDTINIREGWSVGIEVHNRSQENLYIEILNLEPSWQVMRTYPMPGNSLILTPPNEGARFYLKMSLSDRVSGAHQPDMFDRFVVLATSRNRLNFPRNALPALGKKLRPVLEPDDGDGERAGAGVAQPRPMWFVQQLDVRVVVKGVIEPTT